MNRCQKARGLEEAGEELWFMAIMFIVYKKPNSGISRQKTAATENCLFIELYRDRDNTRHSSSLLGKASFKKKLRDALQGRRVAISETNY